jgi:choline dehydrogenase-like flavoprotein
VNRVEVDAADPAKPAVTFVGRSEYTERGLAALQSDMQLVLAALPTTRYRMRTTGAGSTEAHILCTTPMGTDPAVSVVDRTLVHHRVRNLLVLGGSVFPTASPANPTLTISALSMWAAARLLRQGHQP